MTAMEIMEQGVIALGTDATVGDALEKLSQSKGGFVVVATPKRPLAGVVTWKDLIRLMYESGHWEVMAEAISGTPPKAFGLSPAELRQLPITEIMSSPVGSVKPGDSLEKITELLFHNDYKFVVVFDGQQVNGWIPRDRVIRELFNAG